MKQGQFKNARIGIYYLIALFSLAAFGLLLLGAGSATADGYDLPPRDDAETPVDDGVAVVAPNGDGARVHLQAHFSQNWPWETMHWQEDLWLKVQWLDEKGAWQDVDGWQGTLDAIQQKEDWMGIKEIWLADAQLGTGPYRWQIYVKDTEKLLTTSEEFYLPSKGGDLMELDMMLTP